MICTCCRCAPAMWRGTRGETRCVACLREEPVPGARPLTGSGTLDDRLFDPEFDPGPIDGFPCRCRHWRGYTYRVVRSASAGRVPSRRSTQPLIHGPRVRLCLR